jgi:hypothetical protein
LDEVSGVGTVLLVDAVDAFVVSLDVTLEIDRVVGTVPGRRLRGLSSGLPAIS